MSGRLVHTLALLINSTEASILLCGNGVCSYIVFGEVEKYQEAVEQ